MVGIEHQVTNDKTVSHRNSEKLKVISSFVTQLWWWTSSVSISNHFVIFRWRPKFEFVRATLRLFLWLIWLVRCDDDDHHQNNEKWNAQDNNHLHWSYNFMLLFIIGIPSPFTPLWLFSDDVKSKQSHNSSACLTLLCAMAQQQNMSEWNVCEWKNRWRPILSSSAHTHLYSLASNSTSRIDDQRISI